MNIHQKIARCNVFYKQCRLDLFATMLEFYCIFHARHKQKSIAAKDRAAIRLFYRILRTIMYEQCNHTAET